MAQKNRTEDADPSALIVDDLPPPESMASVAPAADMDAVQSKGAANQGKSATIFGLGVVLGLGSAALGYGAALQFPFAQTIAPMPAAVDLGPITARLDALENAPQIGDLAARVDELAAQVAAQTTALAARLDGVDQRLAAQPASADDMRAELAAIRAKLAQVDPKPAVQAAIAAEMGQVEQMTQALVGRVTDAAVSAQRKATLTLLRAALDTGAPFVAVAQDIALPAPLDQMAQGGVPSLAALVDGFDGAARAGLDAALRADMGDGWRARVQNFLRAQTGARSISPRAGNDPDAILSRISAPLRAGDLAQVAQEIASLPQPAQTAMADWIAQLQSRRDALAAYDTLAGLGQ